MKNLRAVIIAVTFFCTAGLITMPASAQQTPYPAGVPWAVPGVIQAEDYDNGGQGVAWNDTSAGNVFGAVYRTNDPDIGAFPTGGYFLGFIDTAEWVEYTVNVATTGQYQVRLRVASAHPGPNNVHIDLGGVNVSGTQTIASTGDWWVYTTKTFNVFLTAGDNQVLRVAFDSGSLNLDYLELVSLTGAVPCSTNLSAPTPQYAPCEFTVAVSSPPANPYASLDLLATMTPPAGVTFSKPVRGFWVGPAGKFKFRFAPTAQGTWQASVPGQAVRTFYVGAPTAASAPGFLRRETASTYVDRLVRDDGSHPFIWGTTYYQIINNARAIPSPTDTRHWSIALTQMKNYGVKKVRLLVYPWLGDYSGFAGVDSQPYGGPRSPCAGGDGTLKKCPDYNILDTVHFDALDKVVDYLYTNGMIADVILFKDPADNNHGDATPPQDNYRTFGDTLAQDQRLARYIVARYAAYPNVTFCLANEWENTQYTRVGTPAKDLAYWNAMGNLVRAEDPYYYNPATNRFRILTIHAKTAPVWNGGLNLAASPTSGWLVAAELQYGIRNENYNGQKNLRPDKWGTDLLGGSVNYAGTINSTTIPVLSEEFGYLGEAKWTDYGADTRKSHRQSVWGLATAGLFGTLGDMRVSPQPIHSAIWSDAPNEYGDTKRLIDFFTASRGAFTITNYWQMRRDYAVFGNKARRVYALSNPTKTQIAIYDAEGTGFNANLPAGKVYDIYSYNPAVNAGALPQPYGPAILAGAQGTVFITTPGGRDTVILAIAR